ncbi:hypothetical protein ABW21_db0200405 [Orbilia brochopaga]|nr:hypothetical protein ABW21_db0200405 [Drechslerella brochopaga]
MQIIVTFFIAYLLALLASVFAAAIPDTFESSRSNDILDRQHYGLRIRDVLDHVYGKTRLLKRQDGSSAPSCRDGGTPTYMDGNLVFCTYDTSIQTYNLAVRDIHFNRTEEDIGGSDPVYISGNNNAVAKRQDGHLPELPNGWDWVNTNCFRSGSWILSSVLETIRYKYCHMVSDLRTVGTLRHVTFYYGFTNGGMFFGDKLKAEDGSDVQVDTEFAPQGNTIPPNNINTVFLGVRPRYLTTPPDGSSSGKTPPVFLDRSGHHYRDFIRSIKNPFISSTIDYFLRSHELAGPKAEELQFPDWQQTIVFTVPELPESLQGHDTDADGIPLPPNTFIANSPSELRDLVAEIIEHRKQEVETRTEDDIDPTPAPAEPERAAVQETIEPEEPEGRPLIRRVMRDYRSPYGGENEAPDQNSSASPLSEFESRRTSSYERPDYTEIRAQMDQLHDDVEWFLIRSEEIEFMSPYLSTRQKYRARIEIAQAKSTFVKLGKRIAALQEIDKVFKDIKKKHPPRPLPTKAENSNNITPELTDSDLDGFNGKDRIFLREAVAAASNRTTEKPAQTESQATKPDGIWDSGAFKTLSDFMMGTTTSSDGKDSYSSATSNMPRKSAPGQPADLGQLEDRMVRRVGEVMSDRLRDMQDIIEEDIEGASKETTKFTERIQSLENLVQQLLRYQEAAKGGNEATGSAHTSSPMSNAQERAPSKQPSRYLSELQKLRLGAEVDGWVKHIVEESIEELEDLKEDEQFDIVSDLEKSGLARDMADRSLDKVMASKRLQILLDELFDGFMDENEELVNLVAKATEESVKELKDAPVYHKHAQLLKRVLRRSQSHGVDYDEELF